MAMKNKRVLGLAGLCMLLTLGLALAAAQAAESAGAWLTSYPKALAEAKATKKVVLADFTGSDWCGYCIRLKKQVLDTPEFQDFAKDKLVLLELDYPRHKDQPADEKQQNADLSQKFNVHGFPTVIILDADGKDLGRIVGFGGKDGWMSQLKGILAKAG